MDIRERQIAVALLEIIKNNKDAAEVDTGDEVADDAFQHGVLSVVSDLEQLLNDMGEDFHEVRTERPFIPPGFRIHAVTTH